jgi:hypothetical protein
MGVECCDACPNSLRYPSTAPAAVMTTEHAACQPDPGWHAYWVLAEVCTTICCVPAIEQDVLGVSVLYHVTDQLAHGSLAAHCTVLPIHGYLSAGLVIDSRTYAVLAGNCSCVCCMQAVPLGAWASVFVYGRKT